MSRIVKNLAISELLSPSLIDNIIEDIFSRERKIVPFNTPPFLILTFAEVETKKIANQHTKHIINLGAER